MYSYHGNKPYLFFSYSHKNQKQVFEIADKMFQKGYRVWYDKSIEAGADFDNIIASHIRACDVFILFLSKSYLASNYCDVEFKYAREQGRKCFAIYLEDCDLSKHSGMEMILSSAYNIYKFKLEEDIFYGKLMQSSLIEDCKRDENEDIDLQIQEILKPISIDTYVLYTLFSLITLLTFLVQSLFVQFDMSFVSLWGIALSNMSIGFIGYAGALIGKSIMFYQQEKKYVHFTDKDSTLSLYLSADISLNACLIFFPALCSDSVISQIIIGFLMLFPALLLAVIPSEKKTIPIFPFGLINSCSGYFIAIFLTVLLYNDSFRWTAFISSFWSLLLTMVALMDISNLSPRNQSILRVNCIVIFCYVGVFMLFLLIGPLYRLLVRFSYVLLDFIENWLLKLFHIFS